MIGVTLLRNHPHGAPGFRYVLVVHRLRSVHLTTAIQHRNPQPLSYSNQGHAQNIVHCSNLLIRHQSREHLCRDMVQPVALLHSAHQSMVRGSGSVRAAATEEDDDLILRGYALAR